MALKLAGEKEYSLFEKRKKNLVGFFFILAKKICCT